MVDVDTAMGLDGAGKAAVRELSRHWCANPLACDTPDGMLRWWLTSTGVKRIDAVAAALTWMKARGLVEELHAADGRVRYRRASGDVEARLRRIAAGLDLDDATNGMLH
jgi:hypothetical protein